jgi:transposase
VRSQIPEGLEASVVELLDEIQSLSQRIKRLDRQVDELIQKHYPAARMFMEQLHGVGPLTALAYVLTLETPERFTSSRDIGAYLGLTRRQRDSGESTPRLHITKAGDAFLRRLLVQCAHYILGPFGKDSDLRRWALKLSERLGRKRAIVACARKLAVLMHHLWTSGEVYEPLRPQRIVEAA